MDCDCKGCRTYKSDLCAAGIELIEYGIVCPCEECIIKVTCKISCGHFTDHLKYILRRRKYSPTNKRVCKLTKG